MFKRSIGLVVVSVLAFPAGATTFQEENIQQVCKFTFVSEENPAENKIGSIHIEQGTVAGTLAAKLQVGEQSTIFDSKIERDYLEGEDAQEQTLKDMANQLHQGGGPNVSAYKSVLLTVVAGSPDGPAAAVVSFFDENKMVLGRVGLLGWLPLICQNLP